MATTCRRITLNMEEEEYRTVREYSALVGESMSGLLVDLVKTVTPGLRIILEAQDKLKDLTEERRGKLVTMLESLEVEMSGQVQKLIDFAEDRPPSQ